MPARASRGRGGRSRKRRTASGRARNGNGGHAAATGVPPSEWQRQVSAARSRSDEPRPERPRPPWHPLPLAEILILFGAIGFLVGMERGPATAAGRTPLLLGIAAVAIGTVEFSLREHRSGFRSHTLLLALLPAVALHTTVVVVAGAFAHVTRAFNYTLLAVDVLVVAALALALRRGHLRAREAHTLGLRR